MAIDFGHDAHVDNDPWSELKCAQKQLLPISGGSPKSSVTFTTKDGRFTIRKVWGDRDQSQLVDVGNGDVLASGGEAEDMVRELAFKMPPADGKYSTNAGPVGNLTKKIERYLPSLSFHQQGDLHVVPDMGKISAHWVNLR